MQWISLSWGKAARGGPLATRRNACPVGLPLPDHPQPFTHRVVMSQWGDFEPRSRIETALPPEDVVALVDLGDRLAVWFTLLRKERMRPRYVLRNQYIRLTVHSRETTESQWIWKRDTFNIAYGPVSGETFLLPPNHVV